MVPTHLLAQSLAYAAMIAGTLEYAILVRHRTDARRATAQVAEVEQTGLQGLVRVFLADEGAERQS
jgi:hypothetical protein